MKKLNLTQDIKSPKAIYLKAFLFLCLLLLSILLNMMTPSPWIQLFSIAIIVWSSARIYYFMFYVIEHYVDNNFKFSGIYAFFLYLLNKKE